MKLCIHGFINIDGKIIEGYWRAWRICEIFKYDLGILKYEEMTTNGRALDSGSH